MIRELWNSILNMLPEEPRNFDTREDPGFWTNGYEILCSSELEMEIVYQFLDDIFKDYGNYTLVTGWYDPFEDAEEGIIDDCTGFNYIRLG